ncbi:protoheme IX farnesyltransferase [archaeon 13_1_40CM_4_53_4]|nr:MAG: protoheme IX farnesyltransferase [archaeon 13_2_20CM_2_53_6]OLC64011.1 MAG: protoheme IX farnesyltransferase [archaeon 13_1_40CM_4_53_4]OLE58444.1 MAG: protoheme IX farnesyltransferase [Crenarchaeota archaeon 13_1_20CM_2_53_14]TMI26915.1 MAG: protoheme IX farnesyltransferase [Candidatus Bathyarchaeota archaeon]
MKPRIVLLLDFTALAAFLATPSSIDILRLVAVIAAGTLASGGAGALNSYLDEDIDRSMGRTSRRPIPQGDISPFKALIFGLALIGGGLVISALYLPLLAGLFILLGAAIYVLFYTKYLKRRTSLNIVLGGSAGSCAPLAGWAAATGNLSNAAPWLMALLVFVWTPSHFWALAMRAVSDYTRARIPMLPVVVGEKRTAQYIALNTFLLVPLSLALVWFGFGLLYLVVAGLLGFGMIMVDVKLAMNPTKARAWTAFKFSSPYLAIVFLAMALDVRLLPHYLV